MFHVFILLSLNKFSSENLVPFDHSMFLPVGLERNKLEDWKSFLRVESRKDMAETISQVHFEPQTSAQRSVLDVSRVARLETRQQDRTTTSRPRSMAQATTNKPTSRLYLYMFLTKMIQNLNKMLRSRNYSLIPLKFGFLTSSFVELTKLSFFSSRLNNKIYPYGTLKT